MEENILGIINILWILWGIMAITSIYCLVLFVRAIVAKKDEAPKKIIEWNMEFGGLFFLGVFFLTLYIDIEMSKFELVGNLFLASFALLGFQAIISKLSEIYSLGCIKRKIKDIMIKDGYVPISPYRFKNKNDEEFDVSYSLDKDEEITKLYITHKTIEEKIIEKMEA